MATSWPSVVIGDYAANKGVRLGRALALQQRSQVLCQTPFQLGVTGAAVTAEKYPIELLGWMLGHTLNVVYTATINGGTGTGQLKIGISSEDTSWIVSDTVTWDNGPVQITGTCLLTDATLRPYVPELGHTSNARLSYQLAVTLVSGTGTASISGTGCNAWVED